MTKPRQWFSIKAVVGVDDVEIYVYGPIGRCWWDDTATSAADFVEQLAALGSSHIALHINSAGGDCFEGQAIHNAVKRHPGGVTAYIDGLCASAATFVALGAGTVVMAANATFMIHKAWTWEIGNADEMRGTAAILDKIDLAQVAVYAAKTGMSADDLLVIMADRDGTASGWYSAPEALAAGFVDQVGDEIPQAAAQAHERREFMAAGIRYIPERFAAALGVSAGLIRGEGKRNSGLDEETLREAQQLLVDAHDKIGSVLGDPPDDGGQGGADDSGDDVSGESGGSGTADMDRRIGSEVAALL
jgi:ATP-dependent protease ClpP protease subunit